MWSPVEKKTWQKKPKSNMLTMPTTIYARFPVKTASHPALEGAGIVIWTTTPWTCLATRAMACGADIEYSVLRITEIGEKALSKVGDVICLASELVAEVTAALVSPRRKPWRH